VSQHRTRSATLGRLAVLAWILCLGTVYAAEWSVITPAATSAFSTDDDIPCGGEAGDGTATDLLLYDTMDFVHAEGIFNGVDLGEWGGTFVYDSENPWVTGDFYVAIRYEYGDPQQSDGAFSEVFEIN